MKFGEKLRQLRQERKLTQPELAEAMGIEQSYLSKLENEKSLPSQDVLSRILAVFEIGVDQLVSDLDQGTRNQLRQIPAVAEHLNQEKQQLIRNRRRWLMASALLLSFGAAFIYAGNVHLYFPDTVYQYKSHGVVLDGEPKELFRDPERFISKAADRDEFVSVLDSVVARTDEAFLKDSEYHGSVFNVEVDGGSRTYYIDGSKEIDPWQSKFVVFVGIVMLVLGLVGVLLERKLSRYP